jgi:hypothetical protein
MAITTIAPSALLSLVCHSMEVYRQESFGYLIVSTKGNNYNIRGALAFQTCRRYGYYEVCDSMKAERAYKWINELRATGDWHSHTYSPRQVLCAKPTETDIKDMLKGKVDLIVAIQKTRRRYITKWYSKDKGLAASINGYKFLIRGWRKIGKNKIEELKLKA